MECLNLENVRLELLTKDFDTNNKDIVACVPVQCNPGESCSPDLYIYGKKQSYSVGMANINLVNVELTAISQNVELTASENPCQPVLQCSPCSPSDCNPGGRDSRCCPSECIGGPRCYPTDGKGR